MNNAMTKANRLLQIESLLLEHQEGLTQSEIARRLGVNRSTIHRYLPDLERFLVYQEGERLFIDRGAYLVNVRFSLHEALAVHLASRLLATRMDRHNPHAASAMRKLSLSLERLAPDISRHIGQSADVMDDAEGHCDPVFVGVLEKLCLAWAETRKVIIWHRKDKNQSAKQYTFSPYFIEPYAIGQSVYIFGWREPPGAIRTFKVERIERVEITRERYSIPDDFTPLELLRNAWGIWYTEAEPVEVVLRFSARVAQRVKETRWHASEEVSEESDGSLVWRARIAEPREMLNWVRGWGSDVEVLKPEEVRREMVEESRSVAEIYGW